MDFHILIVISCVFLASLISLLLINKFFRRKTFEEVIAEKKALTEKIYGQAKAAAKKPRKLQQLKKEQKREKKQRQREQHKDTVEHEDSDAQSAEEETSMPGLSKTHVEFEPEPEVVTYSTDTVTVLKPKSKKDKKAEKKAGILLNKHEPIPIKETPIVEETNFESKHPKDVLELKKLEKEAKKDEKPTNKKEKQNKKEHKPNNVVEKPLTAAPLNSVAAAVQDLTQVAPKEVKQQGSPKNQANNLNTKPKQLTKKQIKETVATKELVQVLDKLSDNDTIGVPLLMKLFRRAELNRSEIQILIDYLLNRQQDMPNSHSEWSDDICQKLKRQLEEKERALIDEQEASLGIQAKLRELRAEINMERAQMNATTKAYMEKMQAKDQELAALSQELQSLNDKLAVERQQFQAKLLHEKQTGSQDLLAQLQLMQNEMAIKDKCINDLTILVTASRQTVEESQQKTDIIQTQTQQIRALEQQRDELEQLANNHVFELENVKTLETENSEYKVELRNLQNALESVKGDLAQVHKELAERQQEVQTLQAKNADLSQQLSGISHKTIEQSKEQLDLQAALNAAKTQLAEKEQILAEFNAKNAELVQRIEHMNGVAQQQAQLQQNLQQHVDQLQTEVVDKHRQLQDSERRTDQVNNREKELLQQLQEQKEKNNDLRMKNWKLVEALQTAETKIKPNHKIPTPNSNLVQNHQLLLNASQKPAATSVTAESQEHIRALYQRLYPEAVKACAATALSASFEEWVEQVVKVASKTANPSPATAIATTNTIAASSSHKSTQSNSSNSNGAAPHNSHNDKDLSHSSSNQNSNSNLNINNNNNDNTSSSNNSNKINNNNTTTSDDDDRSSKDNVEMQQLQMQNAQLRAKIDELTKLVTKTSNTLSDLEGRAREQEEQWRSVVRAQEDKIHMLQHSNGEQDI